MADGANTTPMNRFDLTSRLVEKLKQDEAVIGGIGNRILISGRRVSARTFYMLGSMLAAPIAFGVALAQPAPGVCLEGDGSLLMQLGCLSTIAAQAPRNLTVIVWDNGVYQITGSQPTPAADAGADIVGIARASGLKQSEWASDEAEFEQLVDRCLVEDGPWLIGPGSRMPRGLTDRARPCTDPPPVQGGNGCR